MVRQSELRQDPLTGLWVVLETTTKPSDFEREPARLGGPPPDCPFCAGHERATDAEIMAIRNGSLPNDGGWLLRVIPNKFPILRIDAESGIRTDGLFVSQPGLGAHEVVIETPDHEPSLQDLTVEAVTRVLTAWRSRIGDLARDQRFACAVAFKNHGRLASARLDHAHSQIIAYPFVPPGLEAEMQLAKAHHARTGRGLLADLVAMELRTGTRLVADGPAVAMAPYAARVPFHVIVTPTAVESRFEQASDASVAAVAAVLKDVLQRIDRALERPAYNLILHSPPYREAAEGWSRWWLEILPRINRVGAQEWATGVARNPVFPEDAASSLRRMLPV